MSTAVDPASIASVKTSSKSDEKQRIIALANTPEAKELKIKLAAAYRLLARRGLDDGVAGHISLRVPGAPTYFWVNQFGLLFSEITADNLVLVNEHGEIIDGGPMINSAGFFIHSAIHHARADINCAVHTHPPMGSAYSALGTLLEPLDQTGCSFFEDHAVYDSYTGIVLEAKQADEIVAALGKSRALILKNHGLLTGAGSVEQALIDMLDLERTCGVNLRALASGQKLHAVPAEAARQSRSVLTQPMRYPFQWMALIRELDRADPSYRGAAAR